MSAPRRPASAALVVPKRRPVRSRWPLLAALALAACGGEDALDDDPDGSFGNPVIPTPRDAGMDGSIADMDAMVGGGGPYARVRLLHAIPNTGALLVCHDPDGPGPMSARVLGDASRTLRARFGERSDTLSLPALRSGVLTLQREAPRADAGADAGAADGGVEDPCGASTRESTIPLPITTDWLYPRGTMRELGELGVLPDLAAAPAITLFGTGVALSSEGVEQRVEEARLSALQDGGLPATAAAAAQLEREALHAAFAPRALPHADVGNDQGDVFTLSLLHGIADVPGEVPGREVGPVRLCMTIGSLDEDPLPRAPEPGVPFRARAFLDGNYAPRKRYTFRIYAAADFDQRSQDCASTNLRPITSVSYDGFRPGHSYTLALLGAIAPGTLCGAEGADLVRSGCDPAPYALAPRIEILED